MIVSAFLATIQGFLKAGSRARAAVPSEAGGGADDFLMIEEAPATMSRKAFWPRLSPLAALHLHGTFSLLPRVHSSPRIALTCFPTLPSAHEGRAGLPCASCISAAWDIVGAQNIFVG